MKKGINPKSNLIVTGIKEYLINKAIRQKSCFVITPNESFYLHEGEKVNTEDFENMYPYPVKMLPVNYKGKNPDRTKVE